MTRKTHLAMEMLCGEALVLKQGATNVYGASLIVASCSIAALLPDMKEAI